jgi:hypothetical protein
MYPQQYGMVRPDVTPPLSLPLSASLLSRDKKKELRKNHALFLSFHAEHVRGGGRGGRVWGAALSSTASKGDGGGRGGG